MKLRFRVRFVTKILVAMLALAIIPLLVAFVATSLILRDREEASARASLTTLNDALTEDITRTVEYITDNLQSLANTLVIGERDIPLEIKRDELEDAQRASSLWEDLTLLDLNGDVLASTGNLYRGEWEAREVFQVAAQGQPTISGFQYLPEREGLFHTHAVPISDGLGQWGVLAGQVSQDRIARITQEVQVGERGLAFVLTEHGRFITHPDPTKILQHWEEGKDTVASSASGTAWVDQADGRSLCAFNHTVAPTQPGQEWTVVTCQSDEAVYSAVGSATWVLFGALLISFGLALVLAFVLSRVLTSPIRALARSAHTVQGGDLGHRARANSSDEIGDLARSFNAMTESLAQKIGELELAERSLQRANDELEERVEERTSELRNTAEELERSRRRIVTVQEGVRRDIASHLHGRVQGRLLALRARLQGLLTGTNPDLERDSLLNDVVAGMDQVIQRDVSVLSRQLYPAILQRGLVPALQSLGDQYESALTMEMELDQGLVQRERADRNLVPEQVRLAAYRIAEDALNNVVKHAQATRVTMGLDLPPEGGLRLRVQDDGRGFDTEKASSGVGMAAMQDYAEAVGGGCVVHSTPNKGTQVVATLPFAGLDGEHPE